MSKKRCHFAMTLEGCLGTFHTLASQIIIIKFLLFDDGRIQIYRKIVSKGIFYIDCSGYLVSQIYDISRIFNYWIAIRHPVSKAPALPVFECISSTCNTEPVRRILVHFRKKVSSICGNHAKPKLILCDFSKALINACLLNSTVKRPVNIRPDLQILRRKWQNMHLQNSNSCMCSNFAKSNQSAFAKVSQSWWS